jgi:hypothetical protein
MRSYRCGSPRPISDDCADTQQRRKVVVVRRSVSADGRPVELQIGNSSIYATALARQVIEDVRLTAIDQLFGFRAEDFNG